MIASADSKYMTPREYLEWEEHQDIKPIRNSQFAITFCDGDLDPDTKRPAILRQGN